MPCGRSLGYFPGTLEEKFAPWAVPVAEAIKERIGKAAYEIAVKRGDIELVPFEVMRGRSWKNAFVLFDEAQNSTPAEMKTFLTRIGEDCTVVINGDVNQCDLDQTSGLRAVIHMIKSQMLPVPVIEFTRATSFAREFAQCGFARSMRPNSKASGICTSICAQRTRQRFVKANS